MPETAALKRATKNRVNIRPGVSVLSVLRHLKYAPWFALAEYVDNSLQSFLYNRRELQRVEGRNANVRVTIDINKEIDGGIVIHDNAAGIRTADYARAFRPAEVPPDRSGLCEFGMGLKSASCWFAPRWVVTSTALGEKVERTVTFDIKRIVRDSIEELEIDEEPTKPEQHYTEVRLLDVYRVPAGRAIARIKEHLASIYREFIRKGTLELIYNGEPLTHELPKVLVAPYYKTLSAKPKTWRKSIDFPLPGGRRVTGFAALRAKASTSEAGFALFRRGRIIQGSADEGYRPHEVFGNSNSYTYQRLFGELHLEGFEVSHTKDGFRWDDVEEEFLAKLWKAVDSEPLPLSKQAEGIRYRPSKEDLKKVADEVVERTASAIESGGPGLVRDALDAGVEAEPPTALPKASLLTKRVINLRFADDDWEVTIEATDDRSARNWIDVTEQSSPKGKTRLAIRIALVHPFTERFAGADKKVLDALMRVAAGLGVAEVTARRSGATLVGTMRTHLNALLRSSLAREP